MCCSFCKTLLLLLLQLKLLFVGKSLSQLVSVKLFSPVGTRSENNFMRVFPIPLLSHVRGLIRRGPTSRFYSVPAIAWTNPTISHSEQVKGGNFNGNALELNEIGVLRVLTSMRDDPYLALSFLKRIEGDGALPSVQAYATVIRIVCSWGLDSKLNPFLVELVRKGDESRGFSVVDLLNAIGEVEKDGKLSFLLLSRVSSALVKAYGNLGMFDEAIDMFWNLKRLGLDVDAYSYVIVVEALHRNEDEKGLEKLLNTLLNSERRNPCVFYMSFIEGLFVNQMTSIAYILLQHLRNANILVDKSVLAILYRKVVRGFCNEMKVEDAEDLVLEMEECGIDPDVYVYSAIIEGHRKNMNVPKALDCFYRMVQKRGRINCVIVSSVLQCCCQMGKFSEAYDWFKKFREMDISLDRVCYNVVFGALGKLGKVEEAIELFREMTSKGISADVVNYTTLIGVCCLQGKCSDAYDLMIEMEGTGATPDIVIYNVLAGGLARNGLAEDAFETLKIMEARGVKPTYVTHNTVIEGLIVAGKIDEVEAFYESFEHNSEEIDASMVKCYCEAGHLDRAFERFIRVESPLPKNVYFALFTSLCADKDYISEAREVLERLWVLGVEPDKSMYGKLIGAWCRVNNVSKARKFLEVLVAKKIIPDLYTYTVMINTYCRLNKLKQAYALFRDMEEIGIKADVVTFTVLLNSNPALYMNKGIKFFGVELDVVYYTVLIDTYCRLNNLKKAYALCRDMKRCGIKPDVVTYTVLLNSNPALDMKRDMIACDVKPDVCYYTVLIDQQCKIQDLNKAISIFKQMIESGVEADVRPYTSLIAGCCNIGNVKEAKRIFDLMIKSGLKPDAVSYTALIAGCYRNGYESMGETLLQEMSDKGIELTEDSLSIIRYARS